MFGFVFLTTKMIFLSPQSLKYHLENCRSKFNYQLDWWFDVAWVIEA